MCGSAIRGPMGKRVSVTVEKCDVHILILRSPRLSSSCPADPGRIGRVGAASQPALARPAEMNTTGGEFATVSMDCG